MNLKIGGLFFGYGGLDMAVQSVLGGELAWVSEIDKGALKIIAHRYPGAPNLGDITKVKWAPDCPTCGAGMAVYRRPTAADPLGEREAEPFYWCGPCGREWDTSIRFDDPEAHLIPEPVDILTGGSPCQDLSHAGKRAGMTEGTRSNLWVAMREAIAVLRPRLVVWENVRGAYSAEADSAVEPCAGCVGDGSTAHLRALGRVLGDLSDLGYDAQWHGLRAADVGAPHGRFRVFVVAVPSDQRHEWPRVSRHGWTGPADSDRGPVALLPTPAVNDMGEGKTVEAWDEWTAKMQAKHGNGNGHGASLAIEAQRLLPTPKTEMHTKTSAAAREKYGSGDSMGDVIAKDSWGQYADAIARWESLTRPAPAPTEVGPKGSPRLSARFSEWMMGLPDGWITDVPGITRNEALKACGNGVVPQQAAYALRLMLARAAALEAVA